MNAVMFYVDVNICCNSIMNVLWCGEIDGEERGSGRRKKRDEVHTSQEVDVKGREEVKEEASNQKQPVSSPKSFPLLRVFFPPFFFFSLLILSPRTGML